MARRQAVQQRADHQQVGKLHQLRMQLALLVIALDGAAKVHAALILKLAAGLGVEIVGGVVALGHCGVSQEVPGA